LRRDRRLLEPRLATGFCRTRSSPDVVPVSGGQTIPQNVVEMCDAFLDHLLAARGVRCHGRRRLKRGRLARAAPFSRT
jgi:hypothetical protein